MGLQLMLTSSAWAVLEQLALGAVWDGDLVSKAGRKELIELGLAKRVRKLTTQDPFAIIPGRAVVGTMANELTKTGQALAVRLVPLGDYYGRQ